MTHEHEGKRYIAVERLRSPERLARMSVADILATSLDGLTDVRRVLDIGTGTALFAEAFAARGFDAYGVDMNPEMLAEATKYVAPDHLVQGTADTLPFDDKEFDLAFMSLMLHEVDDMAAVLREAARVATKRVAALEWPYVAQDFGPPFDHRLKEQDVIAVGQQLDFRTVKAVEVGLLVLYLFDV